VLGYEVAGEVESVGEGVDESQVGDRVIAGTRFGGQARVVTVPATRLPIARVGSASSRAPRFPVNYATAYAALVMMGGLREGDGC
jgi:NADPH:quinone reductase-like Zn-dependent oxidoreductase